MKHWAEEDILAYLETSNTGAPIIFSEVQDPDCVFARIHLPDAGPRIRVCILNVKAVPSEVLEVTLPFRALELSFYVEGSPGRGFVSIKEKRLRWLFDAESSSLAIFLDPLKEIDL